MNTYDKAVSIAARSPYGWGHTIEFDGFIMDGLLGDSYKILVRHLTNFDWLPSDLTSLRVADVGCFSGGITKILAERNAETVYAVDEIPAHAEQCRLVVDAFNLSSVEVIETSLYQLPAHIEKESLDLVLLSGVLYHCSDMLVALLTLRDLLKPAGVLLIETNAVDDDEQSYANFGRFVSGMWWQPSSLCISDMCQFMGYEKPEIRFHDKERCFARAIKSAAAITFKRGLNYPFADILDEKPRPTDASLLRPLK